MSVEEDLLDPRAILARVAEVIGAMQDTETAAALNASPQRYATWKARGTIPFEQLCAFAQKRQVSLDWLLLGRGRAESIDGGIDEPLFEEIFLAVSAGAAEVGEVGAAFVVQTTCTVYNRVSAAPKGARARESAVEIARALMSLATAKASLLRGAGRRDDETESAEIVRLEKLAGSYSRRLNHP